MTGGIRLSEAAAQVTSALAALDGEALRGLTERLNRIAEAAANGGAEADAEERLAVEPERSEAVERELRILQEVLAATEENIHVIQRLQARQ